MSLPIIIVEAFSVIVRILLEKTLISILKAH